MSPRTKRRLQGAIPVVIFFVLVSLTWDLVTSALEPEYSPKPGTAVLIGTLIALPLILFESSPLANRFRRLPFPIAVQPPVESECTLLRTTL